MTIWQPILTAPMNGTPILVYLPIPIDTNFVCGYASVEKISIVVAWWDGSGWHSGFCDEGSADTEGFSSPVMIALQPSHWMPLPEPPVL